MKFAILGCMLVAMSIMPGCVNHRALIVDNEWDSLKVGCLVFNGTTYEKRIITIDDHKFLSDLKKKFKISSWSLTPWIGIWGVQPARNRLLLHLTDNQTVEMYYYNYLQDFNLGVEFQDNWTFRAKVSADFINYLLEYLEQRTHSQVRFNLTNQEEQQYPSGDVFYDIDFGHGMFCLLSGDVTSFNKVSDIKNYFVFRPIMKNSYSYLNKFLADYRQVLPKLNYADCSLVYYKKGISAAFYSCLYEDERKNGFQKSHFALLVKEVIRKKAILIIFSGEKTKIFEKTPPLTVCHSERELFNILEHQYMTAGGPYIIFTSKNSTQLKK